MGTRIALLNIVMPRVMATQNASCSPRGMRQGNFWKFPQKVGADES